MKHAELRARIRDFIGFGFAKLAGSAAAAPAFHSIGDG